MPPSVIYALVYVLPAVVLLIPMQTVRLRAYAKSAGLPVRFSAILLSAFVGVMAGIATGAAVGYTVMFGPSHISGDLIGLPWLTMLPALGLGLWSLSKVSNALSKHLLRRHTRVSSTH
jgi:hypothetical protein